MASVPYDLSQGETLTVANPFLPAAIGGDNPTPFYLHFPTLPAGMQWVFPYTYNFMYPIEPPHQINISAADTPPGFPVPLAGSTATALLHAYDVAMAYNAGTQGSALPSQQAKAVAYGVGFNNNSISVPIGAGTVSLALVVTNSTPSEIIVTGVQSGYIYYSFINSDVPGNIPLWRNVIGDTSVSIQVVGACTVSLYASPVAQSVSAVLDPSYLTTNGRQRMVIDELDLEISFDTTIAAGGTSNLLTALGGNAYRVIGCRIKQIGTTAGSFMELRGAPSTTRVILWATDFQDIVQFSGPQLMLAANDGLEIRNWSAAALRADGTVYYKQNLG